SDVERTHCQLRAGFTNRLCSDDADSLADLDRATGCEISSVTLDAATAARFAGQHRTNANALHTRTLNLGGQVLIDLLVSGNDDRTFNWVSDVFKGRATDYTISQRLNFLTTFNDCTCRNSTECSAI